MLRANWCGLAAIGAGLILFAAAAGTALAAALPLILLACLETAWGALTLRAGRILSPRIALAACACAVGLATFALVGRVIGLAPFLALLALHWPTAILIARALRRPAAQRPAPRTRSLLLVLAAEALLVSAITTPALAQTGPGEYAVPHGAEHGHAGH